MRKTIVLLMCAVVALGGCGTYAGDGASNGAMLGSIIGSAIGGISGGSRGNDIGTLVGMAGGAVVGSAIGSAADKAQQEKYRQYQQERDDQYARRDLPPDESGFDPTGSGDDRITFDDSPSTGVRDDAVYTTVHPRTLSVGQLESTLPGYRMHYSPLLEVRNMSFVDRDGDGIIRRGEECRLSFDIMNRSSIDLYDVQPTVVETTGNRHIHISPGVRVERIRPGRGVRYTATVAADRKLRDGEVVIRVAVVQGDKEVTSQVKEFRIATRKK